jgi:hypothetical protein
MGFAVASIWLRLGCGFFFAFATCALLHGDYPTYTVATVTTKPDGIASMPTIGNEICSMGRSTEWNGTQGRLPQ